MLKLNIITIHLFLFSLILNTSQALAISGKEIKDLIKEHLLIKELQVILLLGRVDSLKTVTIN